MSNSSDITFEKFEDLYYEKTNEKEGARLEVAKALFPYYLIKKHDTKNYPHDDPVKTMNDAIRTTIQKVNEIFNITTDEKERQMSVKVAENKRKEERAQRTPKEAAAAKVEHEAGMAMAAAEVARAQAEVAKAEKARKGWFNLGGRKTKSTSRGGRKTRRRR
jgi:hypothetical protein